MFLLVLSTIIDVMISPFLQVLYENLLHKVIGQLFRYPISFTRGWTWYL